MVKIRLNQFNNFVMRNGLFDISVHHTKLETHLIMSLHTPVVNTRELPATRSILKKYVPTVFDSKCFNEKNLPFLKESEKTEIGHLFEHILLEYLCLLKNEKGYSNTVHNGVTSWNWVKEKRGTFRIVIDSGADDRDIFYAALQMSIKIINKILSSAHTFYQNTTESRTGSLLI